MVTAQSASGDNLQWNAALKSETEDPLDTQYLYTHMLFTYPTYTIPVGAGGQDLPVPAPETQEEMAQ